MNHPNIRNAWSSFLSEEAGLYIYITKYMVQEGCADDESDDAGQEGSDDSQLCSRPGEHFTGA